MEKKEFLYDLTIGMIIKNEIKYLRRCLETLQPLRDAISCELIITDTGSTDGSQDVAKEFADVYLEFEWCNDFAKARNTATEIAQGRWFIYVDADNHFDESLLEIASFLQNPQVNTRYDHANITIRNYTDTAENLAVYHDIKSPWLLNFSQGRRLFHYPIHEIIFIDGEKGTELPVIMHHFGYLKEVKQQKRERNLPLMRRLVKNEPKDLKARYQLLVALTDPNEKEVFFQESIKVGLPLTKLALECKIWVMLFRTHYLEHLLGLQQWDKVDALIASWTDYIPNSLFQLHYLGICLWYYRTKGAAGYTLSKDTFLMYQDLFFQQQQNPQVKYYGFHHFPFASLKHYALMESELLQMALLQEDTQWAKEQLPKAVGYTYPSPEEKHPYCMTYCNFAFLLEDHRFLASLLDFIQEKGLDTEKTLLEQAMTRKFQSFSPEKQQEFLQEFQTKSDFSSQLQKSITEILPDATTLKETLLALLLEKRLDEAKPLFLLLEQTCPQDPILSSLRPLFFTPNL